MCPRLTTRRVRAFFAAGSLGGATALAEKRSASNFSGPTLPFSIELLRLTSFSIAIFIFLIDRMSASSQL